MLFMRFWLISSLTCAIQRSQKPATVQICDKLGSSGSMAIHAYFDVWQLSTALSCVERVFHQFSDSCIQALAGLKGGIKKFRHQDVRRALKLGDAEVLGKCNKRYFRNVQNYLALVKTRLTLSNPAMFLFSAKNSAGLFCCIASFFLPILDIFAEYQILASTRIVTRHTKFSVCTGQD